MGSTVLEFFRRAIKPSGCCPRDFMCVFRILNPVEPLASASDLYVYPLTPFPQATCLTLPTRNQDYFPMIPQSITTKGYITHAHAATMYYTQRIEKLMRWLLD